MPNESFFKHLPGTVDFTPGNPLAVGTPGDNISVDQSGRRGHLGGLIIDSEVLEHLT
jgi:hypothetical protein